MNYSYYTALKKRSFLSALIFPTGLCALLSLSSIQVQADPKTVTIGKGSGVLSVTSMKDLEEGDKLMIAKGTYDGGTFTHLKNITIVPEEGGVSFKGPIGISDDESVVFDGTVLPGVSYGFTFSNFSQSYPAFEPAEGCKGNIQNCAIKGVQLLDTGGSVLDGNSGSAVYDGTPASCLYYNMTLDTIKETGRSIIYSGTWAPTSSYKNVNIGMTVRNVVCINNGTGNSTKLRSYSIYNLVCDNWKITGPTLNGTGDSGVFGITGNCTLKNIYRVGGWGWLLRVFNCSLNKPSTTCIYNCIDVDNASYGSIDTRVASGDIKLDAKIPIVGNDVMIANCTSGNHKNATGYVTQLCLDYGNSDGQTPPTVYTTSIINCVAFNNKGSGPSSLYHNASGQPQTMVMKNNVDFPGEIPDGYFVDQVKFYPAKDSPLIGKGMVVPELPKDIYGNPRGDSYDIGAVQYKEGVTAEEPPPSSGTNNAPGASTNTAPSTDTK